MQISAWTHAETKIHNESEVVSMVHDVSQGANPLGNEELRQHDSEGEYQRGLMKIWNKFGDFKPTHFSITDETFSMFWLRLLSASWQVKKGQITG